MMAFRSIIPTLVILLGCSPPIPSPSVRDGALLEQGLHSIPDDLPHVFIDASLGNLECVEDAMPNTSDMMPCSDRVHFGDQAPDLLDVRAEDAEIRDSGGFIRDGMPTYPDVRSDAAWQLNRRERVGSIITYAGELFQWSGVVQSDIAQRRPMRVPGIPSVQSYDRDNNCRFVTADHEVWEMTGTACFRLEPGSRRLFDRRDVAQYSFSGLLTTLGSLERRTEDDSSWNVRWTTGVQEIVGRVAEVHETCVLMVNGGVECDVRTDRQSLVASTLGLPQSFTVDPRRLTSLGFVRKMQMGRLHSCAIYEDGRLSCFGLQYHGNFDPYPLDLMHCTSIFGESDTLPERYGRELQCTRGPVLIRGFERTLDVSVNNAGGTCAVKEDGSVWCWGGGVLWDSHPAYDPVLQGVRDPGRVEGLPPAIAVSITYYGGGIIARDGSVWTWGEGCGDGTTRRCIPPVRIW